MKSSLLIMIHCDQFTGYAIGTLEEVFHEAALAAGYAPENIFWSYPKVIEPNANIIECHYKNGTNYDDVKAFIIRNNIKQVLAFDLGYPADVIPVLYSAGIKNIISYWGASMSSLNSRLKLLYKKLEWHLRSNKPDFFIFESASMQLTATHGRGVPRDRTVVVPLGVDTKKFFPDAQNSNYIHQQLAIPENRNIAFYSGHMEERKGVRVIVNAAIELIDQRGRDDIHFVICGNKNNEAEPYQKLLKGKKAENHVTFAGYRNDIPKLMSSSFLGIIASTGWDSFTMSSVEMMSSGLPLIVSNLQGLGETIEPNVNGFHINPGDFKSLANNIEKLLVDNTLAQRFSKASRDRAETLFSRNTQIKLVSNILGSAIKTTNGNAN